MPGNAERLVDRDVLPRLEPDRVEPDVGRARRPPDRDEDLVRVDRLRRRRARRARRRSATPRRPSSPSRTSTPPSRSAVVDLRARERLLALDQPLAAVHERHLRAQGRPRLRHLDADHAAAEHEQPAGGTRFAVVASMFVHGRASREPRHRRDRRRAPAREHHRAPRDAGRRRRRARAARRRAGRARGRARRLAPRATGSCDESSRSWTTSSRRASTASTSSAPVATPGTRRASAASSTGRRSAFDGMHAKKEHSPPTSRSSTIATSTPASPSLPAITSPGAPAPITTTSNARSLIWTSSVSTFDQSDARPLSRVRLAACPGAVFD